MKAKQMLVKLEKEMSQHLEGQALGDCLEISQELKIELIRLNETLNYYKDMEQWMEENSNDSLCDWYNR